MKRALLFTLFLFIAHSSFSQAVAGYRAEYSRVVPDSLYAGLYNRYKLVVENCPCNRLFLKGNHAEIIKEKDCVFYIRPLADTVINIDIYKGRRKVEQSIRFEITNNIPLPFLRITKKQTEGGSIVGLPDSIYVFSPLSDKYNSTLKFKVISYTIEVLKKEKNGKVLYSEFIMGDTLTRTAKNAIGKATPREYIHLKDITFLMPDNKYYTKPHSWFYIGI